MSTTAKVVCDSISESGQRITTMVLEYPRIIHSEFMTHRMFSRNASSSRAIPVDKQIERVETGGFIPSNWGVNQKGMSASANLNAAKEFYAKEDWLEAKHHAVFHAKKLVGYNVHKQLANRLLEPFSHIQVIVTATEWDNFFLQRLDKNAQPEIQELAKVMKEAMDSSTPKLLKVGEWHTPFIEEQNWDDTASYLHKNDSNFEHDMKDEWYYVQQVLKQISVARCARVSYGLNERGWGNIEKDLALYDMLLTNNHWSPFEHQATAMPVELDCEFDDSMMLWNLKNTPGITHMDKQLNYWSSNFKGWIQNRQLLQQN